MYVMSRFIWACWFVLHCLVDEVKKFCLVPSPNLFLDLWHSNPACAVQRILTQPQDVCAGQAIVQVTVTCLPALCSMTFCWNVKTKLSYFSHSMPTLRSSGPTHSLLQLNITFPVRNNNWKHKTGQFMLSPIGA